MDNLDDAIKVVDDKIVVTLDKDCVALVMNTKRPQFRTLATESNEMYLQLFNLFMWLISESPMAQAVMPTIILAWKLDTNDGKEIAGMTRERKVRTLKPRPSEGSLADALFKNVLKKGK